MPTFTALTTLTGKDAAEALAEAGTKNPDLAVQIILPGTPDELAHEASDGLDMQYGLALQYDATQTLQEALGDRLILASPVRPVLAARDGRAVLAGSPMIHVHNKVLLCDTDYALVGSANLNGRSMRWDTEVAVEVTDPAQLGPLRSKVLSHWWGNLPAAVDDARETFDTWQQEIRRNGVRRPENRNGFLVPYDPENGAELAQNLPGATEDIV